ncbi:MAG: type II secretion system protein GspJ, partial [Acinetobacter calcoaceticus]
MIKNKYFYSRSTVSRLAARSEMMRGYSEWSSSSCARTKR